VSEGQRRRIQLVLKLMAPHDLCLLDEATTDLDIIARRNLLLFLLQVRRAGPSTMCSPQACSATRRGGECLAGQDSRVNGTTVVYCTHIFDGLDGWATHLALLADRCSRRAPCPCPQASSGC